MCAAAARAAGSLTRTDIAPAEADAPVIAALRARGVIPFGKTNLSEFAFSGLGLNPHFGTPLADFAGGVPRAPGGSSSGSAIAVQRGIVAAAIGTDTAGSIRVPAAFNGLVGYKGFGGPLRHARRPSAGGIARQPGADLPHGGRLRPARRRHARAGGADRDAGRDRGASLRD